MIVEVRAKKGSTTAVEQKLGRVFRRRTDRRDRRPGGQHNIWNIKA
jgi:hypothetical protein